MENGTALPDWHVITENRGDDCLDFSVNVNPLGLPQLVKEQIPHLSRVAGAYPDPECRALTACLAEKYQVGAERILCGNGADDLLYRLIFALRPRRALVVEPTFEEYGRALEAAGCEIHRHLLSEAQDFAPDRRLLADIPAGCEVVFLCNPNNPTGQLACLQILSEISERCRKDGMLLVVDECFLEFLPDWRSHTLKQAAAQSRHLLVIDAFTKTCSLAGFRLGFCISGNEELLCAMRRHGQDFAVSSPAQLAGICALRDAAYLPETYRLIPSEREWLYSGLKKFPVRVFPSQGNFLLLKTPVKDVRQRLLEKGVKVRDCSAFYGLGPEYCRVAVRTRPENRLLLQALSSILEAADL